MLTAEKASGEVLAVKPRHPNRTQKARTFVEFVELVMFLEKKN